MSRKAFIHHVAIEGVTFLGSFFFFAQLIPLITHLSFRLTVQVVFVLRGVSFANHSPDGTKTPKQPLQKPSCGRLALKPAVTCLASDHAAVQLLALSLGQPRTSTVIVELKDAVGKVILLFLPRCLGLSSSVSLSVPSTSRLNSTAGVYGEDVAKDTLGWGEVHLWGAGRFGIETAKGWGIGEGCVEARQGRGRCARFVNERHKGLWSSEHLAKWKP